jgi:hypothetical protein
MTLCARCLDDASVFNPRPAVKAVLAYDRHGTRETPLCRAHLDQWHQWCQLIYGRAAESEGSSPSPH